MPELLQRGPTSPPLGRVLFASPPGDGCEAVQKQLWTHSCDVVTAGLGEALWLWHLSAYDLVLIRAVPETGIELCRQIKADDPTQRVILLLDDNDDPRPYHSEADAVLCGEPSKTKLLAILAMVFSRRLRRALQGASLPANAS